ncbi:MAG: hypothetical protein ACRD9L_05075 [Bryobacteraceae bacterium]
MRYGVAGLLFALSLNVAAQSTSPYTIEPAAGVRRQAGDAGPATSALLWSPHGVEADAAGNLYIADTNDARVRKVSAGGTIATIAGTGAASFGGDSGPAPAAGLSFPTSTALSASGDLYVADAANHRVRKISASGAITTIAGTGTAGYTGDWGPAAQAKLDFPLGLAMDRSGNLYIADTYNNVIREVTADGRIGTIAGHGNPGDGGDGGPAAQALLSYPRGVALDSAGNLYIADTLNHRIRKVTTDGTIATVAGRGTPSYDGDGGGAALAGLNQPSAIGVDAAGNLYIADTGDNAVRVITPQGTIRTLAGSGCAGFAGDNGPAVRAQINAPQGVSVDANGNVFIADTENHRIRRVNAQGAIATVAGSDPSTGDSGPALAARLFEPGGVAFDAAGNLYVSETASHRVRKVTPHGAISTVAGTGIAGYSGDGGSAMAAQLNDPNGLATDGAGNLYIADTGNNALRMVNAAGVISTIAGTGDIGNSGDGGPAKLARLFNPNAVARDAAGNLYVADSANHRVRKIGVDGTIQNFAGDGQRGLPGFGGDGGPAAAAALNYPRGLAIDAAGNVYIADFFNNRVRKVAAGTSTITTFAGTGEAGGAGDGGAARQARLNLPAGLAFDKSGNLYIADSLNERIRTISAQGVVQTAAGTGGLGDSGDGGPAGSAALNGPRDVALDSQGRIYFADQDNDRVRRLTIAAAGIGPVVNAASGLPGAIAPGESITLFGFGLGPQIGVSGQTPAQGALSTTVGGASVVIGGVPAPLLYVSAGQINAIVPYEVAGESATQIQVQAAGNTLATAEAVVAPAAPGIFSVNGGGGSGQGAILNQDGSVNSAANPAARGSIVSLFATGEGQTVPAGTTGAVAGGALAHPVLGVTVTIGGEQADLTYAGAAPGSAGAMQINTRIPDSAAPGSAVSLSLTVGSYAAQSGVTIAIQ